MPGHTSAAPSAAFRFAHPLWYVVILFGLSMLFLSAAYPTGFPPPLDLLQPVHSLAYFVFRTQSLLIVASIAAAAVHLAEAAYVACVLLPRKGVRGWSRLLWPLQTAVLGFPPSASSSPPPPSPSAALPNLPPSPAAPRGWRRGRGVR